MYLLCDGIAVKKNKIFELGEDEVHRPPLVAFTQFFMCKNETLNLRLHFNIIAPYLDWVTHDRSCIIDKCISEYYA